MGFKMFLSLIRLRRGTAVLALVVGLVAAAPLFADQVAALQQKKETLKGEIARIELQNRQVDSLAAQELSRFKLLKSRHEADLERRHSEIADLEAKIKEGQQQLATERNRQTSHKAKAEEIRRRHRHLLTVLKQYCDKLEALIALSVPWERDGRQERLRSLRRDIDAQSTTAEEAFSRLNALIAEEARFGDEIALVRGSLLRNDGEAVNATLLRFGNQTMVYMDDQEKKFGILDRVATEEGGWEWSWREELSFAERDAVRRALEVKGNRRPPELVVLPVGLQLARENRKEAAVERGGDK